MSDLFNTADKGEQNEGAVRNDVQSRGNTFLYPPPYFNSESVCVKSYNPVSC